MTIVETRPNELMRARLDFFKPFAGVGEAEHTLTSERDKTVLSWTMTGKKIFITKRLGCSLAWIDARRAIRNRPGEPQVGRRKGTYFIFATLTGKFPQAGPSGITQKSNDLFGLVPR
jgi:hypothetical protein